MIVKFEIDEGGSRSICLECKKCETKFFKFQDNSKCAEEHYPIFSDVYLFKQVILLKEAFCKCSTRKFASAQNNP
jgi:hypothetical protein